jgi:8-oxo-dGTP pyrophosphatase MutT (NUDIX family)
MVLEHHKPNLYVCGVYLYNKDTWVAGFEITDVELIEYAEAAALDPWEYDLIVDMLKTQLIYENWWQSLSQF